jgi:hypothetical protein
MWPTIRRGLALGAALTASLGAGSAPAAPTLVPVGGEFTAPVHVASPPEDPRIFVVSQNGLVQVIDDKGVTRATPFIDLTQEVVRGSERGLLSIAFAPDYTTSGLFYVYLTAASPEGEVQVREYRRSATDAYRADPSSARMVLRQAHSENSNHNGGSMLFGPDGKLWLGIGDGGGGNDPMRSGQSTQTLLGKILRIDRSGAIPPDNPFASSAGGERKEIWAYGLRNPWRFSFDRQTGDLIIADVGQDLTEEVDFAPASAGRRPGANYGWVCFEGSQPNPAAPPGCQAPGHVPPVHEGSHAENYRSITGGYVVRDPGLPTLVGRYLYGDINLPRLRSIDLAAARPTETEREEPLDIPFVSTFGEDACGRLLVASHQTGRISRIVDGQPSACNKTVPALPAPGTTPGQGGPSAPHSCGPRITVPRKRSARSVLRSGLRVLVARDPACSARLSATLRRAGGFRTRRIAPGKAEVVLRLRLSRVAARAVRRGRRGTVRIRLQAEGPPGTFLASAVVRLY